MNRRLHDDSKGIISGQRIFETMTNRIQKENSGGRVLIVVIEANVSHWIGFGRSRKVRRAQICLPLWDATKSKVV